MKNLDEDLKDVNNSEYLIKYELKYGIYITL